MRARSGVPRFLHQRKATRGASPQVRGWLAPQFRRPQDMHASPSGPIALQDANARRGALELAVPVKGMSFTQHCHIALLSSSGGSPQLVSKSREQRETHNAIVGSEGPSSPVTNVRATIDCIGHAQRKAVKLGNSSPNAG